VTTSLSHKGWGSLTPEIRIQIVKAYKRGHKVKDIQRSSVSVDEWCGNEGNGHITQGEPTIKTAPGGLWKHIQRSHKRSRTRWLCREILSTGVLTESLWTFDIHPVTSVIFFQRSPGATGNQSISVVRLSMRPWENMGGMEVHVNEIKRIRSISGRESRMASGKLTSKVRFSLTGNVCMRWWLLHWNGQ